MKDSSRNDVVTWCNGFLTDYLAANSMVCVTKSPLTKTDMICCQHPSASVYKINTDAAMDVDRQGISVGVVIRDHQGFVMDSSSQWIEACYSPQVAEAVAILRGIDFAIDTNLVPTVVESNVLGVVNLVNSGTSTSTDVGLVVDDSFTRIHCRTIG
ncbi:hypothetical protein Ddye_012126 [Dipteronia dyeriana]|uniref:RNase H type-1 domain-containing protein n=1 Tax=Dipteronia dyeriana TaxID=168575 RepID=A0AAE0CI80_9ROSI|nr:hypothetical protein Ddye_012126 [Dipteronia dyeriana]